MNSYSYFMDGCCHITRPPLRALTFCFFLILGTCARTGNVFLCAVHGHQPVVLLLGPGQTRDLPLHVSHIHMTAEVQKKTVYICMPPRGVCNQPLSFFIASVLRTASSMSYVCALFNCCCFCHFATPPMWHTCREKVKPTPGWQGETGPDKGWKGCYVKIVKTHDDSCRHPLTPYLTPDRERRG